MKTKKLTMSFLMISCLLISVFLHAQPVDKNLIEEIQKPKEVDKDYFKNITSITTLLENVKMPDSTQITSFQFTHVRKSFDPVELKSTSDNFTKEMTEVLTHLKSGDRLYFEYIIAKLPDETTRRIAPLNFLVK